MFHAATAEDMLERRQALLSKWRARTGPSPTDCRKPNSSFAFVVAAEPMEKRPHIERYQAIE